MTTISKSIRKAKKKGPDSLFLKADGEEFDSPRAYFEYVSDKTGYPPYFKHFEEDIVDSDGVKLHLDIYHVDKEAPTLIFIPDSAVYTMCYGEFLYKLGKQGYNVIGMDLRGQGRSGGMRGHYTVVQVLSDIVNTTSYAIEKYSSNVSLVGSGLGGILAFYMAALDKRLQSVVCHNIADLAAPQTKQLIKHPKLMDMLSMVLKLSNDKKKLPIKLYTKTLDQFEIPYFGTIRQFMESDPLVLKSLTVKTIKSIKSTGIPAPVEEIEVPVMAISGTEDHIFPVSYTQWLFEKLPGRKRLQFYQGLDHFMLHKDTDVILPPVLDWLEGIHEKTEG